MYTQYSKHQLFLGNKRLKEKGRSPLAIACWKAHEIKGIFQHPRRQKKNKTNEEHRNICKPLEYVHCITEICYTDRRGCHWTRNLISQQKSSEKRIQCLRELLKIRFNTLQLSENPSNKIIISQNKTLKQHYQLNKIYSSKHFEMWKTIFNQTSKQGTQMDRKVNKLKYS